MYRTTIMIPDAMKSRLETEAEKEKISFGELVRRALQKYLLAKKTDRDQDGFLSSETVFRDEGQDDVSSRHDHYLTERNRHDD